ncbi:MAG TPA: hypothetical protein VEQ60_30140 [Longimicrobium sp.]|nr:hypothetical protein [Longimicrobium sp.]
MYASAIRPARWLLGVVALAAAAACTDDPTSVPAADARGSTPRLAIPAGPYTPGQSYTGRNGYIEYIAGNTPVIFAAPHGGSLTPAEIPDRTTTSCDTSTIVTQADANTEALVREIQAAFYAQTGKYPHVIINKLYRGKLDPNRSMSTGACGDAEAEIAWDEYHDFINAAKSKVSTDFGRGWYTDIHGHGHTIQRLEIGYLLEASDLQQTDGTLDGSTSYENESSFRTFSAGTTVSFSGLLRGDGSLGTLLEAAGYPSVPSTSTPAPGTSDPYFTGGYSLQQHGCAGGGNICGLQIEHNYTGVRDNATNRAAYAAALVRVYETYLAQNFSFGLGTGAHDIMVDNDNANNDTTRAKFTWTSSWALNSQQTDKHLNSYRLADGAGPTNDGAAFKFYISSPGTYKVYAWWTDADSRTTSASYRVFELDGGTMLDDLTVNQQTDGGQWNLLGTYTFGQVGWGKVLMSRSLAGAGKISADAIRVVKQ